VYFGLFNNFIIFVCFSTAHSIKNFNFLDIATFKSITSDYLIFSFLYATAGFLLYGILPVIFSKIGLTNTEFTAKKREKLGRSLTTPLINEDDDRLSM
jgi:hypothetical protein